MVRENDEFDFLCEREVDMRAPSGSEKFLSMRKTQSKYFKFLSLHLLSLLAFFILSIVVIGYSLKASGIFDLYSRMWFDLAISSFILASAQILYTLPTWWRIYKRQPHFVDSLILEEEYSQSDH